MDSVQYFLEELVTMDLASLCRLLVCVNGYDLARM